MKYRIGIDLGTNSLGWAAIELREGDETNKPVAGPLIDMGVRIFSDARNPKDKSSNAAQRRGPRGARRNRDRKLGRGKAMMHALSAYGLMPKDRQAQKAQEKTEDDPWILRADALDMRLSPFQIGRSLFHLQQRRGFKSNRKADGDDDGAMHMAIEAARAKMQGSGAKTLGQLYGRQRKEQAEANNHLPKGQRKPLPSARVKATRTGSKMSYDYYPDRAMILDEFDLIWAAQAKHHPELMTEVARTAIRRVIEHQRPLKAQRAGKCTLIEGKERASRALPTAQYSRILQEVNNLTVGAIGDQTRPLSPDERTRLLAFLLQPSNKTGKRTFKSIRTELGLPESQKFNLESHKRDHLMGDETAACMMQGDAWGQDWLELKRSAQDEIIIQLLEIEQYADLVKWLKDHHELGEEHAKRIANVRFGERKKSPSKLSKAALDLIIPHLETGLHYDKAVVAAGFKDHRALGDGVIHEDGLPYYGEILSRHTAFEKDMPLSGEDTRNDEEKHGRVANPTVHVALNELRKVINDLVKRWGPPEEVVLELARDLPLSAKGRGELERAQGNNQKANEARNAYLKEIRESDNYNNRLKLRLYEEACEAFDGKALCVFTGEPIPKTALFSHDIEIEHILPLSRTLDDSFANKVLSTRRANRVKRNNTPHEAFGDSPEGYDWEAIGQRASTLSSSKAWRFAPDAMEKWQARGGDFLARQLNDTRYIARLGKTFVEALFGGQGLKGERRRVWVVPGQLTSDLRHYCGFNNLVGLTDSNKKDRTDHRHHAIDALVVALTDQAMVKRCADLAKREDRVEHYEIIQAMAEPLKRYRKSAEDRLSKLLVSHKPDHGFQDAMHNDTAFGVTGKRDEKGQMILVTRKRTEDLGPNDIVNIVDPVIRRHFAYETDGLSGSAFTQAIVEAGKTIPNHPPVHSVRITTPMNDSSYVTISHGEDGKHAKAYKGDGNYCYDIFLSPKGKWDGEVITTFNAYQRAQNDPNWWQKLKRADGTPIIMRIRKGDMLEIDEDNGERIIIRVYEVTPGKVIGYPHNEAVSSKRKGEDKTLKVYRRSPASLQKLHTKCITVTPSGKVRRHKA